MERVQLLLFSVAFSTYALSLLFFVVDLLFKRRFLQQLGFWLFVFAACAQGIGEVAGPLESERLIGLLAGAILIFVSLRHGSPTLLAFIAPFNLVFVAAAIAFSKSNALLPTTLRSSWFSIHLSSAILADALLSAAGILALVYLVQDQSLKAKKIRPLLNKLPPIHVIDQLGIRFLSVGFVLMTVGMMAGTLLAQQHWGDQWYLDARQWWSLGTWLLCAAILFARLLVGFRGRRAAVLTIATVFFVVTGLLGLNLLTATKHGQLGL